MVKAVLMGAAAMTALTAHNASATTFSFLNNASAYQTQPGLSVFASAWSTSGLAASDLPTPAYLGRWIPGFGVTNQDDNGGRDNQHTIDNDGRYDFVALYFSQAVRVTDLTLNAFGLDGKAPDKDGWISYANVPTDGKTMTGLWPTLYQNGVNFADGILPSTTGEFGNVWLIGAARTLKDRDDGFKLASISVTAAVPEPLTWALMMAGIGMTGAALRRRPKVSVSFGQTVA